VGDLLPGDAYSLKGIYIVTGMDYQSGNPRMEEGCGVYMPDGRSSSLGRIRTGRHNLMDGHHDRRTYLIQEGPDVTLVGRHTPEEKILVLNMCQLAVIHGAAKSAIPLLFTPVGAECGESTAYGVLRSLHRLDIRNIRQFA
jgi:hypothetical protein